MITVHVNGTPREHPEGSRVDEVARAEGVPECGSAVALNGEVIPRHQWTQVLVSAGDRIEIVTAVQGG